MSEQTIDPGREVAWGDVMMPEEAARRRGVSAGAGERADADANPRAAPDPPTNAQAMVPSLDATLREDTNAYAFGATTLGSGWGAAYARLPLGPGNEAMEGGASPAPRGYTGGAMGKFVAGLSPSFADAARGDPAPGGDALYTAGEAATTFGPSAGIAHRTAGHAPEHAPSQRPTALNEPSDTGNG